MSAYSDILIDTNELSVALAALKSRQADGIERHFMGALRVVFDDVDRLRKLRFTYEEISKVFQSKGIDINSKRLRTYMSKIRREKILDITKENKECSAQDATKSHQRATIGQLPVTNNSTEGSAKCQYSETKSTHMDSAATPKNLISANNLHPQGMHLQLLRSRG